MLVNFLDYFAPCMNQPFVDAKGLAERPVKPVYVW